MEKKVEKQEKKNDLLYTVIEMRDGLQDSVENLDKLIPSQNDLIEYIKKDNRFKDTTIELIQQNEKLKMQRDEMAAKKQRLDKIIEICEKDPAMKAFLTEILSCLVRF